MGEAKRRVFGVLCTYRRLYELEAALAAIDHQTLGLDLLVVVDNEDDPAVRALVEDRAGIQCLYIGVRPNAGPAGAFNVGLSALPEPEHGDLVVLFDDDDPPATDDVLSRLVARLDELTEPDPAVGGIGLHGGVLDTGKGLVTAPEGKQGVVPVDHLHGAYHPVYRRSALDAVGGFDAGLFWGFEELELGRRLTAAGSPLFVDMDHWGVVAELYPKARDRQGVSLAVEAPTVGRYYSLRNLLRVLGRERAWWAIVSVVTVRAIGKPLAGLAFRPRAAVANLALNLLAVADAARRRTGPRDRFPSVCALSTRGTVPGRVDRVPVYASRPEPGSEQFDVAQAEQELRTRRCVRSQRADHQGRPRAR